MKKNLRFIYYFSVVAIASLFLPSAKTDQSELFQTPIAQADVPYSCDSCSSCGTAPDCAACAGANGVDSAGCCCEGEEGCCY